MTDRRPTSPRPRRKRPHRAAVSRIATAGVSASATFALVAVMGQSAKAGVPTEAAVPDTAPTTVTSTTLPAPPPPPVVVIRQIHVPAAAPAPGTGGSRPGPDPGRSRAAGHSGPAVRPRDRRAAAVRPRCPLQRQLIAPTPWTRRAPTSLHRPPTRASGRSIRPTPRTATSWAPMSGWW